MQTKLDDIHPNPFTAMPSVKIIVYGVLGALFFGAFSYLCLTLKWTAADDSSPQTILIFKWVFTGLFLFFTFYSLIVLISFKTVSITNDQLIIRRPLLLLRKAILIQDIVKAIEENFSINTTHRWSEYYIYSGVKSVIELRNGSKVKINSFEISNYPAFVSVLRKQIKTVRGKENTEIVGKRFTYDWEGYGALIFAAVLTIGLIYGILMKR
jgi:hypothetical protein